MNKLTLLSGQVKNLKVRQMTKSVFASNSPQKLAEAGALTAAALGSVYASTVMASSRLKMTQEVEVFSCEVNGVKLVGCFGEVTFMNHNTIEFVVEYINEEKTEAIAHAARNEKKKVIWVSPYQDTGDVASRKSVNRLILILFPSLFFLLFIFLLIDMFTGDGMALWVFFQVGGAFAFFTSIIALIFKLISRVEIKDSKKAAEIFFAFGYEYPSEVNLDANSCWVTMEEEEKSGQRLPELPKWVYRYHDDDLKQPSYPSTIRNVLRREKELKEKYGAVNPSKGAG